MDWAAYKSIYDTFWRLAYWDWRYNVSPDYVSDPRNGTTTKDDQNLKRLEEIVANIWTSRQDFINRFLDPHKDINQSCNYPDTVLADLYRSLYDRGAIAERVVQLLPKECFQVTPLVYEDESAKKATEFEEAWDDLGKNMLGNGKSWHQDEEGSILWSYLLRADILSGIGVFGIILLGIDDGRLLQEPADGVPPDGAPKDITGVGGLQSKDIYGGQLPRQLETPLSAVMGTDAQYFTTQFTPAQAPNSGKSKERKLLFIRCFDESLVQVVQYEASMYSPRFGQPIMYLVTLNDPRQPHTGIGLPLATVRVHWSRVIHLADNLGSSEIFGVPRMRPVLNNILDLRKLYGGSAEMYWRGAFPGLSIETNPQLGGDVIIDKPGLTQMMTDYQSGLNRWLALMGMTAKSLAPQVSDPSPQIQIQLEAVCIQIGCPVRVFKGSERGELASSQDDADWNGRILHRQKTYVTPKVIVPFIDRLIQLRVLPEPEGYSVEWPDLDSTTKKDKSAIALSDTQALVAYIGGNVEAVLPPQDFLTRILGWDEEEAKSALADAAKAQEEKEQEQQDLADEHGMIPEAPPGFQHPEPPQAGMPGGPPMAPVKVKPGEKLVTPPTPPVAKGTPTPNPEPPSK